jgi:antitoxin PrlF
MNECGEGFRVDAIVAVDSKGQIVLPKDIREKAKLKPGDKLAIVACEKEGEVCCLLMLKAEGLGEAVREVLSPALKQVIK